MLNIFTKKVLQNIRGHEQAHKQDDMKSYEILRDPTESYGILGILRSPTQS